MKKLILLTAIVTLMPLSSKAQGDDMYFSPKKGADTEKTYAKKQSREVSERSVYYCGSSRDVDEYNRHGQFGSYYQKVGTDSVGNDIVTLKSGRGVYPDTIYVDTTRVYSQNRMYDNQDYDYGYGDCDGYYSRYSAFFAPWYYGPYWRSGWGMYSPWYSSCYYGWYDPWCYDYYWGWNYPYYGGYWGWYDRPYWGGNYGPSYYSYRGVTGTSNHGYTGRGVRSGNYSGNFGGYRGGTNASSTRSYSSNKRSTYTRDSNFRGSRNNTYNNNDAFRNNSSYNTPSRSSSNSSFSSGSFGGGRSGGGSFGGGGGGGRSGGGSFGGRR
jgi:hypothetical protein